MDTESLSHTQWNCKYHIVFAPKYRRQRQETTSGGFGGQLGNWLMQEYYVATGAMDLVMMDMNCSIPGLKTAADRFHTKLVSVDSVVRMEGVTDHIDYAPEKVADQAKELIKLAIETYKKRGTDIVIPSQKTAAIGGFSVESIRVPLAAPWIRCWTLSRPVLLKESWLLSVAQTPATYGLRRRGLAVTVVEMAPQILAHQLDGPAAAILANDLKREGVNLITGTGVKEIEKPSLWAKLRRTPKQVSLTNGEKLNADMVILATGTRSNVAPVKETKIKINRGILVDNYLATNVRNIFAAGDVAESRDAVTGRVSLSPIWPNAVLQGRFAAYNMAGIDKDLTGMISMMNAVEFREVPAVAIGVSTAAAADGYEVISIERPHRQIYKKLVIRDNTLVGMILVGDIQQAGVLGTLIRNKTDITDFKDKLIKPGFSHAVLQSYCA